MGVSLVLCDTCTGVTLFFFLSLSKFQMPGKSLEIRLSKFCKLKAKCFETVIANLYGFYGFNDLYFFIHVCSYVPLI